MEGLLTSRPQAKLHLLQTHPNCTVGIIIIGYVKFGFKAIFEDKIRQGKVRTEVNITEL
jgi:hypothetical protein